MMDIRRIQSPSAVRGLVASAGAFAALAVVLAAGCGKDPVAGPTPFFIESGPSNFTMTPPARFYGRAGETVQYTAAARSGGDTLTAASFIWSSSNPQSASVDSTGLMTVIADGSGMIQARYRGSDWGGAMSFFQVWIVTAVAIDAPVDTVAVGGTVQLSARPLDSDGETVPGRSITWSSSDSTVLTVDASGLVQAVAPGEATISAIAEGVEGSRVLTVVP